MWIETVMTVVLAGRLFAGLSSGELRQPEFEEIELIGADAETVVTAADWQSAERIVIEEASQYCDQLPSVKNSPKLKAVKLRCRCPAAMVAEVLQTCQSLEHVSVEGLSGCFDATSLLRLPHLRSIEIRDACLACPDFGSHNARAPVEVLVLQDVRARDTDMLQLLKNTPKVEMINLYGTSVGGDVVQAIFKLENLKSLTIGDVTTARRAMAAMPRDSSLYSIVLPHSSELESEVVALQTRFPSLKIFRQ